MACKGFHIVGNGTLSFRYCSNDLCLGISSLEACSSCSFQRLEFDLFTSSKPASQQTGPLLTSAEACVHQGAAASPLFIAVTNLFLFDEQWG